MRSPHISVEEIARVTHEANRAYCLSFGDASHAPWDEAPEWQKESARAGVTAILEGNVSSSRESHESWAQHKQREGWKYGAVKDAEAKTHPCLLPYDELPLYQRKKDELFMCIVHALSNGR